MKALKINKLKLDNFDWAHIFFDLSFYILGILSFYDSLLICTLPIVVIALMMLFTSLYNRSLTQDYRRYLTEFLNYINSNLSTGMTFEHAILSYEKDTFSKFDKHISNGFEKIIKAIRMNLSREQVLKVLYDVFPVKETQQFSNILCQSMSTGANQSFIVSITLDKLHIKQKTLEEINTILFQKKAEQRILCLAPMVIIFMIKDMSPGYMDVMYTTLLGNIIMTVSFLMVIFMKVISTKITNIDF